MTTAPTRSNELPEACAYRRPVHTTRLDPADWDEALGDVTGPQLIVAGPGTGKTEFLVRRAIRLVTDGWCSPGEILVLTFSRRSAADIGARIGEGLGRGAGVDSSTFHSFAHRLLEVHWDGQVGTLLTGPEQIRLVGALLAEERHDDWHLPFRPLLTSTTFAEEVADFLLRCQERLLDPKALAELAKNRSDWRALPGFFRRYADHLRSIGRIDYATLVLDAIATLSDPQVAEAVSMQHRFILVDEYQDTSPAQARLLEALTQRHHNLTVTGDPYQSVYSFRGADLRNMAEFSSRFRDSNGLPARRMVLTRSFRVPGPIMEAALRVTSGGELPGSAGPVDPADHPGRVEAHVFDQQSAEAEWIASEVERLLVEESIPPKRIAVLVRSKRRLLPELSRALDRRRLPHDEPDGRLVDHPLVRMVLDLAQAAAWSSIDPAVHPAATDEVDRLVRRILLGPLLAVPVTMERSLLRERTRLGSSWADILRGRLPEAAGIPEALDDAAWATQVTAADGFWHLWTRIAAFDRIVGDPAAALDRAALTSFAQALGRQADRDPSLTLLGYAALVDEDDFEATPLLSTRRHTDRVALTTLHQAKGLEFDVVFIADATEDVFPDTRRSRALLQPHLLIAGDDPDAHARFRLQEEMRLAYTAMTRARSRVVWTATGAGVEESGSRPSRFLLAAAGVQAIGDLEPAPGRTGPPVSALEIETMLRRTLVDPAGPAAERLAAARVLAKPVAPLWDPHRFAGVAAPGPDSGIVDLPLRLSPSAAEAYETCPRRYAFERRVRLTEASSPYLRFGSMIHMVLETVERRARDDGRPRSESGEAIAEMESLMEEADFGSPVLAAAWRRRGQDLFERLYAEWPTDSERVLEVEHVFEIDVEGVRWMGRADRIERTTRGTVRIVDYKTGSTLPTRAEAAGSLQLGFYALAAATVAAPDTPIEAELWFPLGKAKGWRLPFDPSHLPMVRRRLAAAAAGIAAEDWVAKVGTGCRTCPVRLVCDRWPEGREAFVE